jgi:hypothetical protein
MKTFSTSGTGNQQTLSEIESDKIPIYDSVADAEADLANLADGQIGATADTGSELSAPTDTVQSGNMHAVTSNAVARALSGFVKNITVSGTTDINGNLFMNLGRTYVVLAFIADHGSLDSNYNVFCSTFTDLWYIHASTFNGAPNTGSAVSGTVYYI